MKINLKNLKNQAKAFKMSPRRVVSMLLLVIFLISLLLYIEFNIHKTNRIFFFPDHQSGNTIGEIRKIPGIPFKKEENMDIFIKELLLGPINMKLDPLFTTGTKLEKILYRDKIVYIDLNFMALFPDKRAVHGFRDSILLIEKNIKFNFPYVKRVIVTILGQKPEISV